MTRLGSLDDPGPFARLPPRISIMEGIMPPAIVSSDCVTKSNGGESPKSNFLSIDTHLQQCHRKFARKSYIYCLLTASVPHS